MLSLTAASRVTAPQRASVSRIPIATARSTRPGNSASVARQHSTDQPLTTIAPMASSVAAMSISKPINQAIASPSAPKPISSLPSITIPGSELASDYIQACRQRIHANREELKKRRTAPVSTVKPSSIPSRAVPPQAARPAVTAPVSILKTSSKPSREIPPPPANPPETTHVSNSKPSPSCRPRGTMPYKIWIDPRRWKTTPAEADVNPERRRAVRFADNLVEWTREFRPWFKATWVSALSRVVPTPLRYYLLVPRHLLGENSHPFPSSCFAS